jgi:uncharacterized phage-associated protein
MTYATTKIAKFFIEKANSEEIETPEWLIVEWITNLKLQKIIYFAHAYSLVKTGSPLVTENFQARKLWPVLKTLYAQLKSFGNEPIPNSAITDITSDIDTSTLSMLNSIWGDMWKFSASELVRMSHDHWPWVTVYRENVSDIIIPNRIIKLQFSKIFID